MFGVTDFSLTQKKVKILFFQNSFLGSSLNEVVVFNLEVTYAARFALKTTNAFNEEPKKGKGLNKGLNKGTTTAMDPMQGNEWPSVAPSVRFL